MTAARAALLALLFTACLLLVACGGGGGDPEDHPDQPTPGVDCVANPELCK
jgi:hypothetical protein